MVSLITGAGGMMGSHLYEMLESKGEKVIPTYYSSTLDERDSICEKIKIEMDVQNIDSISKVIQKYQPSVIYHLAAQSRPDVSFNNPRHTFDVNFYGTLNLLESCKNLDTFPLIINASSSAVYGDIDWTVPPDESSYCNPLSPYGTSKLAQEHLIRNYNQMYGIPYINVRIFNCSGPRKKNDLISDMCQRVVSGENPIRVGNLEGKRSIVDVRDLVEGLWLCKIQGLKNDLIPRTMNLGGDTLYSVSDIVNEIVGDRPIVSDPNLFRPTDENVIFGDINLAKSQLNWKIKYSLKNTITDTIKYWESL